MKYPSTPGRFPTVEADRMLTRDDARRIAANIAKLLELLCKPWGTRNYQRPSLARRGASLWRRAGLTTKARLDRRIWELGRSAAAAIYFPAPEPTNPSSRRAGILAMLAAMRVRIRAAIKRADAFAPTPVGGPLSAKENTSGRIPHRGPQAVHGNRDTRYHR